MYPHSIELERESGNPHIAGRETMATYILLLSFTDQGIRNVKDSPKRADTFKDMAKKCGATVKDSGHWESTTSLRSSRPQMILP
jgi:GYD domain-containing protein